MAKKYDVVAGIGEYQDRDGNTKVRWLNCGSVFQTEKGFSLKLDCVPVGGDGWFKLFEPRKKEQAPPPPAKEEDAELINGFDDDIPF